jgi:catechol 2,3-dioxygenase-like lactoylglutathione lyase family enzyme
VRPANTVVAKKRDFVDPRKAVVGSTSERPFGGRSLCPVRWSMIERIEHVQLAMPLGGEEAARRFYAGILGIPEVLKPANLVVRGGAWFVRGDVRVHFGVERDFRPAKKAHPAFRVSNLRELAERLRAAGFEVAEDESLDGYERVYTADPFGNRIELMEKP